jgi:hypothetical protein
MGSASPSPTQPVANAASGGAISASSLEIQLAQLSAKSPQKLNWQTSIVDLMKLVGLDPSLANRKQLAQELGYKGVIATAQVGGHPRSAKEWITRRGRSVNRILSRSAVP